MDFKPRSIYQLPNGRELVAASDGSKPVLRNLSASEPGTYEMNEEGRLLFNGQITAWEVQDLVDTGRTSSPDLAAVVTESAVAEYDSSYESL